MRLPRFRHFPRVRGTHALLRRVLAVWTLFLLLGYSGEATTGVFRDGDVHHESAALASAHEGYRGEHGHEDGPASDHSKHGAGHEHGTAADHCTHHHSTALPASSAPVPRVQGEVALLSDPPGRPARISTTLFHPPRA